MPIILTNNADDYTDSSDSNIIFALAGNDTINDNGGNNIVFAGRGDDQISTNGNGNDLIYGDRGNDYISDFGGTTNTICGGDGNDSIYANGGSNFVTGDDGNDLIRTSNFLGSFTNVGVVLTISGGNGSDTISASVAAMDNAIIDGGDGSDSIGFYNNTSYNNFFEPNLVYFPYGNSSIFSGNGNDTIDATSYNNLFIDGGNGSDSINASILIEPTSNAQLSIDGGSGDDTIQMNSNVQNFINSGDGADVIKSYSKFGSTNISSENGADYVYSSIVPFSSAANNSEFFFNNTSAKNLINTGNGSDTIEIIGGTSTVNSGQGADLVNIRGTFYYNDISQLESQPVINLSAENGNDTLNVGEDNIAAADMGAGNDIINIKVSVTYLFNLPSFSEYFTTDTIIGGSGHDVLNVAAPEQAANFNSNFGSYDSVIFNGGAGNDIVTFSPSVIRLLGNDTIIGGDGHDIMASGAGNDLFVFAARESSSNTSYKDIISDFSDGNDKIEFKGLNLSFNELNITSEVEGVNIGYFDGVSDNKITILGISVAQIDNSDFIFT